MQCLPGVCVDFGGGTIVMAIGQRNADFAKE
jgi:hypothetical protein